MIVIGKEEYDATLKNEGLANGREMDDEEEMKGIDVAIETPVKGTAKQQMVVIVVGIKENDTTIDGSLGGCPSYPSKEEERCSPAADNKNAVPMAVC